MKNKNTATETQRKPGVFDIIILCVLCPQWQRYLIKQA